MRLKTKNIMDFSSHNCFINIMSKFFLPNWSLYLFLKIQMKKEEWFVLWNLSVWKSYNLDYQLQGKKKKNSNFNLIISLKTWFEQIGYPFGINFKWNTPFPFEGQVFIRNFREIRKQLWINARKILLQHWQSTRE